MRLIRVKVTLFGKIRDVLGKKEFEIEIELKDACVRDILYKLMEIDKRVENLLFTKFMRLRDDIKILVNGRPIELFSNLHTPVKEGAEVCIFTAVGGG